MSALLLMVEAIVIDTRPERAATGLPGDPSDFASAMILLASPPAALAVTSDRSIFTVDTV